MDESQGEPDEQAATGWIGRRDRGLRGACVGSRTMSWRSVVDVDIIGASDPDNKLYTSPQSIACSL
jgi:hypothetical protein